MDATTKTPAKAATESKTLAAVYERKEAARKAAWKHVADEAAYCASVSASYDF